MRTRSLVLGQVKPLLPVQRGHQLHQQPDRLARDCQKMVMIEKNRVTKELTMTGQKAMEIANKYEKVELKVNLK